MTKTIILLLLLTGTLFANSTQKVSLQLHWKHQFEFAGYYMAKERGFYEDVGLDVDIKEFDFGIDIADDVHQGKSTFGLSYASVVLEKSKGKDIVLLSAILQVSPHILVSLKSSPIKSIKDFKDKRIMINKSASHSASFISMLQANGISLSDMEPLEESFNINDLIDGKTDIFTAFTSNEIYVLEKRNIEHRVWDPKDYGFEFYDGILFTSNDMMKNNSLMVDNFTKASLKGWKYAYEHIDETVDLILKKYNTQNKTRDALLYEANALKKLTYYKNTEIGEIDKIRYREL
ncbi:MAG: ABC transporter substrate-binding protein [Campylobacterota bacterium]|nr:ABC transporter substrate-binding protein [Campylobacterota bacterium]